MNVEPAILIISKSASTNPKITCTMIEFLYMLKGNYFPNMKDSIGICIEKTMFDILSKRVISNLESILLSDQIGQDIKRQTKEIFACNTSNGGTSAFNNTNESKMVLLKIISTIERSFNDPKTDMYELTNNFVEELGKISNSDFEEIESNIVTLITKKFNNFQNEDDQNIGNWADGLRMSFNDSDIEKDIIDMAIERISLLPLTEFNIEKFLMKSPKSKTEQLKLDEINEVIMLNGEIKGSGSPLESLALGSSSSGSIRSFSSTTSSSSASTSTSTSTSTSMSIDMDMNNEIEDEIKRSKSNDSKLFYSECFTQFYSELLESENIIEIIGIILEDTDPNQLLALKTQLITSSRNPIVLNWINFTKYLSITREWDGYCQIFLWDLILICLKQIPETLGAFKGVLKCVRNVLLPEHSEICNGIVNLAIALYPKSSTGSVNEYFSWFVVLLEEGGTCSVILSILSFYWRSNSRLFLQSLVRLDEERESGSTKVDQKRVQMTLSAFSKTISGMDENTPAKKSLLSCIDTTIALLSK